jgi:hypothetical protein
MPPRYNDVCIANVEDEIFGSLVRFQKSSRTGRHAYANRKFRDYQRFLMTKKRKIVVVVTSITLTRTETKAVAMQNCK